MPVRNEVGNVAPLIADIEAAWALWTRADACHTGGTLSFADFERTVSDLAAAVKPGGVLVLRHANFRFTDCAAAAGFELVCGGFASAGASGLPSPVYGRDDELLDHAQRDDGIYRRL